MKTLGCNSFPLEIIPTQKSKPTNCLFFISNILKTTTGRKWKQEHASKGQENKKHNPQYSTYQLGKVLKTETKSN